MAMSKAKKNLPEEIIFDILYLLPVKSIGRCRCVSKQWNNFLSDPQFIKSHFTLHDHKQEEKLILATWLSQLHTVTFYENEIDDEIDGISRKLNFEHLSGNWVTVAGSCNGLVLVVDRENIIFLINPTTLKYHKVPVFDLSLPLLGRNNRRSCNMYGFGYDVVSDDYKVVNLSYYDTNHSEYKADTFVDMYSVRKGVWKRLETPYDHSLTDLASGVLVNGVLHWLACRKTEYSTVIAAFDLTDEKFLELPGPIDLGNNCFMCNLAVIRGCLSISTSISRDKNTITFWMMIEYGVKESWTKFKITEPDLDDSLGTLLCSITDDDLLLDVDEELVVYNMREEQRRDLMIDVTPVMYEVRTFRESLLSPSFGNETEG
ncbi:F-box/kelch-repeat protein At3g06240-like [Lycium ferocissimum]|uniref:F-box/kelch-repeat protein At3g06240-like n=1 Tax=Lycium ferocissimum TaxID=112874 RepID=UPI0028157A6E|nr:F-box/kelch-repeat protein At3g06240-like [Lycium ferocissimum]XP_059311959.1 F-box/kelch-repeat protein At3g06240-like [Lycium ferocissimum]